MANQEPDNYEIEQWAAAVEKLSRGSLRIDVRNRWRERDSDYEEHTVADLCAGKIDLANIGARAWDLVGVTSFQALVGPLLVDFYELELEASDLQELPLSGVELDNVGASAVRADLSIRVRCGRLTSSGAR